mgnify:CR=1 FL=1
MKTLLYGGTFDPPHNGHMNNLRAALALVQPDRALVMPAGTPPHKHASATPGRACACRCVPALQRCPRRCRSAIGRYAGAGAATPCTRWNGCTAKTRTARLYLCVGSDMLLTFQEWYRWQDMLKMAALVVESRTGTDEAALHAAAAELKKGRGPRPFCPRRELPLRVERHPQREDPAGAVAGGAAAGGAGSDKGASAVREPVGRPAPTPPYA